MSGRKLIKKIDKLCNRGGESLGGEMNLSTFMKANKIKSKKKGIIEFLKARFYYPQYD